MWQPQHASTIYVKRPVLCLCIHGFSPQKRCLLETDSVKCSSCLSRGKLSWGELFRRDRWWGYASDGGCAMYDVLDNEQVVQ